MLDAELGERPADLGRLVLVDGAAGLGRVEVMAAAVGVERAEQPPGGDYLAERPKCAHGPFLVNQKGGVDLRGGVVHGRDQVEFALQARNPAKRRAVLQQHHPRQRPPQPLLAMARPPLRPRHQTRLLQLNPGPGVAVLELRLGADPLVEVLHVEVEVTAPVLLQHPLDPIHRRRPARCAVATPVDQTLRTLRFMTIPKPAKMPLRNPQYLRRLQTAQASVPVAPERLHNPGHPYLR